MAEQKKRRRKKPSRQEWKPNGFLKTLYALWLAAFSVIKIALGAVATVAIICAMCLMVFVGILGDYLQEDVLPEASINLDNYDLDLTSNMYYLDSNGDIQLLQEIYTSTDRKWASFEEIPEDLIHAAVAIEDKRFYEHQGVDWFTTAKAFLNMFFGGGGDQFGGSTITQQFIKNYTQEDSVTIQRKILEIFRATDFEKRYDKDVVMEWYLNYIYLGQGCSGVKSAAEVYFGKELELLTTAECASLISITNNPSIYDPYGKEPIRYNGETRTGLEWNKVRKEFTLGEMLTQGWITQEAYDEAMAQELVFKVGISEEDKLHQCPNENCGYRGQIASLLRDGEAYICPQCSAEIKIRTDASATMYSWFVDTVFEDVARDLMEKDGVQWGEKTREIYMDKIKRGGYNIYTTINMDIQNQVDKIYTNLDEIPETRSGQQLWSAIVIIDNATGDIVAMSGCVGEKEYYDQWNCATDAMLQPGSSIKPLTVYGPAFQMGFITPATVVKDMPFEYEYDENGDLEGVWPANDDRVYRYRSTIQAAIMNSVNAAAVSTLDMIGVNYSYNFAKDKFGLSGLTNHYELEDGRILTDVDEAPLAMGAPTVGITVRDMASAYAALANEGTYREGRTYTKVYDSNGNLVLDNTQDLREILGEKAVTYLNYCLDIAVQKGTGTVADFDKKMGIAGKTGTTADAKDRWFCGYTPYYTAAVWCGYETPEVIQLVGDKTNPAGRLWKKVMAPIHQGLEPKALYDEEKLVEAVVCLDSGKLATAACSQDCRGISRTAKALVYPEDFPTEYCDKHVTVEYCASGDGVANVYCKHFADVGKAKLKESVLLKLTQSEVDEIIAASKTKLQDVYSRDDYVYLITNSGADGSWKGFAGTINQNVDAPYKQCTVHTKESWEEYQREHNRGTEPTEDDGFHWPWF